MYIASKPTVDIVNNPSTSTQANHPSEEFNSWSSTAQDAIIYEQPLNERIRTLLRLEFLFLQARTHIYRHSVWDSRASINTLFDIVTIFGRSDLKTEIIKELERQTSILERWTENPHVDHQRLNELINEIDVLIDRLHAIKAQNLDIRHSEFLSSIKQRNGIAGGNCDFDLPAYHYWLSQAEEQRVLDLQKWFEPFDPIREAISLILRLVRDSGQSSKETAEEGFFQKSLDSGINCQLIRVTLAADQSYFAEISGGKHRFTVRFMQPSFNDRPSQIDQDISFKLTCCLS